MTKAMRWGLSALISVGCVGLGTVVGCSEDEDNPPVDTDTGVPPTDTGTPVDTGTPDPDTGTPPPGDSGGDTSDAPPFMANRAATVLFSSPDLGGKYLCAGAFSGDPAMAGSKPAQTLGPPAGVPDPTAPTDPMKFKPLPYGAVVHVPLSKTAQDVMDTPLSIVLYLVDGVAKDCTAAWEDVRATPARWFSVKGTKAAGANATNSVAAGDHALIRVHGCVNPAMGLTGECGPATAPAPLKIDMIKLDTAKPATFAGGTTGPKVGLQFVHVSPFAGNAAPPVPSFQNIDVWFQPMTGASAGDAGTDGGDGGTTPSMPASTPVKIATAVKFGDKAATSVGVQIAGDPNAAVILLTPTGVAPCTPGSAGCATVGLPIGRSAAGYKMLGIGGFDDGTNQFIGLAGSPVPKDLTMPTTTTTISMPVGKVLTK